MISAIISAALTTTNVAPVLNAPTTPYSCERVAGIEGVISPTGELRRFIIMGEMHGTIEAPRLFGQLVCNVSFHRPVNVFLEFAKSLTTAVQAYIESDGSAQAKRTLLSNEIWNPKYADGRNSDAMLHLVEALRALEHCGADIRVFSTQPDDLAPQHQFYRELARANEWARLAAERPEAVNMILVGNAHAASKDNGNFDFLPAAAHLRPADTLTIGPSQEGGAHWGLDLSPTGEPLIGVRLLSGRPTHDAGITMLEDTSSGWNALYAFGVPATPSPPARR